MFKRLFPWFDERKEMEKDKRTDIAVEQAHKVEVRVRQLAASYQAAGLVVQKVRTGNVTQK